MKASDILSKLLEYSNLNASEFSDKIGLKRPQALYDILNDKTKSISGSMSSKILSVFPEINKIWILTGEGDMLNGGIVKKGNTIPFYDDVSSIGGTDRSSNMEGVMAPSDYIDTGDWFKSATAAIRHYGDSMREYPSGCILAIKEVLDKRLIVPGRDYVIETNEYRVTKQVQLLKEGFLTAYSTNEDKYPDGNLVHAPFDIPIDAIKRLFSVLGYVVKKNGGTIVFNK